MPAQTASFGPLHISMQIRLYLHPVYPGFTTSGGFSLLPFGIVVEPFLNPFPMIPVGHWSFSSRASPYIASKALVIELDGAQHLTEENKAADVNREAELRALGITVLRYSNTDINRNFNTVCEDILSYVGLNAKDIKR